MKAFMRLFKGDVFFILLLSLSGLQWGHGQTSADMDGVYYNPDTDVHPAAVSEEDLYEGQYGSAESGEYVPRVGGQYFDSSGNGPEARVSEKSDRVKVDAAGMGLSYDLNLKHSWGPSKGVDVSYNVIGFYPDWRWGYPYRAWNYGWWGDPFGHYAGLYHPWASRSFGWGFGWSYPYSGWGYHPWSGPFSDVFYRRYVDSERQRNPPVRYYEGTGNNHYPQDRGFAPEYRGQSSADKNSYRDRDVKYYEGFRREYGIQEQHSPVQKNPPVMQRYEGFPNDVNRRNEVINPQIKYREAK